MDQINHRMIALSMLALAGSAYGAHVYFNTPTENEHHRSMIENRLWLEHMPEDELDLTEAIVFVSAGEPEGMGVLYEFSQFRMYQDLFFWDGDDGDRALNIEFPQEPVMSGEYTLTASDNCDAPPEFELCLTVRSAEGGADTFYSRWDLEMGSLDEATAKIRALAD